MRDQTKWTDARDEKLRQLWTHPDDLTQMEIGRRLNCSTDSVRSRARRLKLPAREPQYAGWSDEHEALLRKLWGEGKAPSEIARQWPVKITRNAITGKAHRLGLPTKQPRKAAAVYSVGGKPDKRFRATMQYVNRPNVVPMFEASQPPRKLARRDAFTPLPDTTPVLLVGRPLRACAWPVGGHGADMLCCGLRKLSGGPYCVAHDRMASPPPAVDRQNLRRVLKGTEAA